MANNDLDFYKKFTATTFKEWTPIIATLVFQIIHINPTWNSFVGIIIASIVTYKDLVENRGKELLEFIKEHGEEFSAEVIKTDSFKASFATIWDSYLKENSENKRRRLRKYLLRLGLGASIDDDLKSKIQNVIANMTDLEAEIFGKIYDEANSYIPQSHMQFDMKDKIEGYPDDILLDTAHSLHAYRLITISLPQIGLANVRAITKFGKVFYETVIA